MRADKSLSLVVVAAFAASFAACGSPHSSAGVPSASGELAAAPSEASAAAPTATDTPLALRAQLERLPRRAAVYGLLRPTELARPFRSLLNAARRERLVGEVYGNAETAEELLEGLGVDASRPVAFALMPPVGKDGRELVELLDTDRRWEDLAPQFETTPPVLSTLRVIVPTVPGTDAAENLRQLAQRMGASTELCSASRLCAELAPHQPSFVAHLGHVVLVVYGHESSLELDFARVNLWKSTDRAVLRALGEARSASLGGPEGGRCHRLDAGAAASLCVDADRTAAFGSAQAHLSIASALTGFGFDAAQRRAIARQGLLEVGRITELANPSRRLLDDGTIAVRFDGQRYRLAASWRSTTDSRSTVAATLPEARCMATSDGSELYALLGRAFPTPGSEFSDPRVAIMRLRESGWAGLVVAFARTWPNFAAPTSKDLPRIPDELATTETCLHQHDDVLELELRGTVP